MSPIGPIGTMKKSSATVALILILTACSGGQASTEPDATGTPEPPASSAPV